MAKEETAQGLLSKMVKFVRNPTTNWSDLDTAHGNRDDSMSKQLLKEMIERKRRNDFVRKREFDMLRKMRKRDVSAGADADGTGRPSFFQSSLPSTPGDRAITLKKIDDIEAQMAMQWWKNKNEQSPNSSLRAALGNDDSGFLEQAEGIAKTLQPVKPKAPISQWTPLSNQGVTNAYRPTEPASLQSDRVGALKVGNASPLLVFGGVGFQLPPTPTPAENMPFVPSTHLVPKGTVAWAGINFAAASDFSNSKLSVTEASEDGLAHDTEIEEAAIRFANGDDAGAEEALLSILAPGGPRTDHPETWLTLFDLYRATAQRVKFEASTIGFVERFNRSAPQWFSMPDMVRVMADPTENRGHRPLADWVCPSVVGPQTVATMRATLAKAAMPWRLDWRNIKSIDSVAVDPLISVLSSWSATSSQVRFMGDAQLQRVLLEGTPAGDRNSDKNRWQLRLEALRVTNRPDDFEMAALDFCVTFELSPPAWESAKCQYRSIDASGDSIVGDSAFFSKAYRDPMRASMGSGGDSQLSQIDSIQSRFGDVVAVEMSGQVLGDEIAVLHTVNLKLSCADVIQIDCRKLIRVDFSAAGSLLNWSSAREAEGRLIHFQNVNRLVSAFFNVIGITTHAKVAICVD
jgi:ABC-type transporter Mla MlaB component